MENVIVRVFTANGVKLVDYYSRRCSSLPCRLYATSPRKNKKPHPYRNIHPWKSLEEFSKSLVAGVIHNEDGLVAINKPYGISGGTRSIRDQKVTGIVRDVNYTLLEAAPLVASQLGHPSLKLLKTPEKFTSGVALLGADEKVEKAVEKSLNRAVGLSILPKTYWIVTTRVPNEIKGEMRLAMKMMEDPTKTYSLPVIVKKWSAQEKKRHEIKILNVQFEVISNSTGNLSSLVQIKSSTTRWHALRLFAATVLYSPILGDDKYGSRVKKVLGKWMNLSPFVEAASQPPKLEKELLELLRLSSGKEALIPAHTHLREIYLPRYSTKKRDLVLIAPPMPEFAWTCGRLEFKHDLFKIDDVERTMEEHARNERFWASN